MSTEEEQVESQWIALELKPSRNDMRVAFLLCALLDDRVRRRDDGSRRAWWFNRRQRDDGNGGAGWFDRRRRDEPVFGKLLESNHGSTQYELE